MAVDRQAQIRILILSGETGTQKKDPEEISVKHEMLGKEWETWEKTWLNC